MYPRTRFLCFAAAGALTPPRQVFQFVPMNYSRTLGRSVLTRPSSRRLAASALLLSTSQTARIAVNA